MIINAVDGTTVANPVSQGTVAMNTSAAPTTTQPPVTMQPAVLNPVGVDPSKPKPSDSLVANNKPAVELPKENKPNPEPQRTRLIEDKPVSTGALVASAMGSSLRSLASDVGR